MSKLDNDIVFQTLYGKYKKLMLDKKEVSAELGISTRTLDRKIKANEALPKFVNENGKYLFPITEISKYLKAISKI